LSIHYISPRKWPEKRETPSRPKLKKYFVKQGSQGMATLAEHLIEDTKWIGKCAEGEEEEEAI
jgi:hypothetical protein